MTTDNEAAREAELRRRKAFESIYVPAASLFTPDGEVDDAALEQLIAAVNAKWGLTGESQEAQFRQPPK